MGRPRDVPHEPRTGVDPRRTRRSDQRADGLPVRLEAHSACPVAVLVDRRGHHSIADRHATGIRSASHRRARWFGKAGYSRHHDGLGETSRSRDHDTSNPGSRLDDGLRIPGYDGRSSQYSPPNKSVATPIDRSKRRDQVAAEPGSAAVCRVRPRAGIHAGDVPARAFVPGGWDSWQAKGDRNRVHLGRDPSHLRVEGEGQQSEYLRDVKMPVNFEFARVSGVECTQAIV